MKDRLWLWTQTAVLHTVCSYKVRRKRRDRWLHDSCIYCKYWVTGHCVTVCHQNSKSHCFSHITQMQCLSICLLSLKLRCGVFGVVLAHFTMFFLHFRICPFEAWFKCPFTHNGMDVGGGVKRHSSLLLLFFKLLLFNACLCSTAGIFFTKSISNLLLLITPQ